MTLHIAYNHQCPRCQAFYIPYDADVPCPRCGCVEEERFDFIPQAANSALFNRKEGSYVHGAWWVGSYGDHVLSLVFQILEQHRNKNDGPGFAGIARKFVDSLDWKDQKYAKNHVFSIACKLYDEMQRRPAPPVPENQPIPDRTERRERNWWRFWQ